MNVNTIVMVCVCVSQRNGRMTRTLLSTSLSSALSQWKNSVRCNTECMCVYIPCTGTCTRVVY